MNLVITGSTSGIGLETIRSLYPNFNKIILPVRNLKKALEIVNEFKNPEKFHCIEMDLSSIKSVDKAGRQISETYEKVDLLINNAGGIFPSDLKTKEGLDWSFAVNHLGHFHLTNLLLSNLTKAKGKIIFVSSEAHRIGTIRSEDLGLKRRSNSWSNYGTVKLYNILTSNYFNYNYGNGGISTYSLHPGAVKTSFGSEANLISKAIISLSKLFFISAKKGAETSVFLANTPKSQLQSGGYYISKKLKNPISKSKDLKIQKKLYDFSLKKIEEILS
ncbi:SDR family NAD(P)-dependent oxidoreductase [Algoriphagus sp.]|uniref:SDR family NAD(P)-dependent oxidoreductase n=1 Tax=Algoriphagus sp. TaxID=1872435 RepID=UPI0025EA7FB5|nr:SDR family NAD(P)-dependent oxidoreductase [Algoriphagus sp.]